ncbi:MAG: DNA-processing protein DprA [Mariprofundales bacterium]
MNDEQYALLRLHLLAGVGAVIGRKLLDAAGSATQIFSLSEDELMAIDGVGSALVHVIKHNDTKNADNALAVCRQHNIGIVSCVDDNWPPLLTPLDDAPLLLFYKGSLAALSQQRMLAIVGSRKASQDYRLLARRWGKYFSSHQVGIVSGMAYGIDAAAHQGVMDSDNDKQTHNNNKIGFAVGVIASGLAACPETQRQNIQALVKSGGCVVSEQLPTQPALAGMFPRRNRIIAGLAYACVVIEANEKSGALITAHCSMAYGREVFAVPGSVLDTNHMGCHILLREGAALAATPDDIWQTLAWRYQQQLRPEQVLNNTNEQAIADILLQYEKLHIDILLELLAQQPNLDQNSLATSLLELELRGIVSVIAGDFYMLSIS